MSNNHATEKTCLRPLLKARRRTRRACIVARSARAKEFMSTSATIALRISKPNNEASEKSNVAYVESCTTQLDCVHIWPYNIRWNSRKTRHGGRARKLQCDAVWRVLNLKNDGTRYREAPRRGRSLTRLRQEARMINNIAITRIVKRWHRYNAKCSALPQQISQENFGGRQCTGAGTR